VTKNFEDNCIYRDEVVKVNEDRFKSIKFRHTYYATADFCFTMEAAKLQVSENIILVSPASPYVSGIFRKLCDGIE
jgi:hypothetical protein